jgi:predicted enzyme related to lactoylglutathione lyase
MLMDKTIVHFEIYGDNPTKLASFYQQLFGWKIEKAPSTDMDYWMVKTVPADKQGRPTAPGVNGGLMKRPMPDARAWLNYVAVDSIEESLRELQKLGGTVMRPKSPVPKMGWFAIVTDPEKNVFALWENDAKAS